MTQTGNLTDKAIHLDLNERLKLTQGNIDDLDRYAGYIHDWAQGKGFWLNGLPDILETLQIGAKLMLVNTELSEWAEGLRHGEKYMCDKPGMEGFSNEEEEAADVIIRVLDLCCRRKLRIAEAIKAKMAVNEGRPHMHGKKF